MINPENIRNIAIIAHVDHGKTTLVDQLLKAAGTFGEHQVMGERVMDSMDLEREKGITIKAKNTSIHWMGNIINIVDTPGHADFGAEVERVMKMVDGVLLLVDAYEGPQAQTRFVLKKALQQGLTPVVVINKVDREQADVQACQDKILELLLELEASEEQFNAPFIYASARDGYAMRALDDVRENFTALLETVLEKVPAPVVGSGTDFQMLVSNIDWDDYVGRVAVGRIQQGQVKKGDQIFIAGRDGGRQRCKVTKVFEYTGLGAGNQSAEGVAGDIVGVAGFEEVDIGVTLCGSEDTPALPFVDIDPATIQMEFAINDGPFSGKEGKHVTSRQIRDRLIRETRTNISLHVEDTMDAGVFRVSARGSMQIAVLVEQMRREGYEVLVSRPAVITRHEDGKLLEPFEVVYIEVPEDSVGGVMKALSGRRARVENMTPTAFGSTIEATMPTRGLIGFELELVNLTSGRGIMSHLFKAYGPFCGEICTRLTGTLVSMETGLATAYSLAALEDRGRLFVGPAEQVYVGQIIGENPRADDLPVNPTKEKHLTNHRSSGDGKGIQLSPPVRFSLERAIEYLEDDEYLEATPKSLRLRKKILCPNERRRLARARKTA